MDETKLPQAREDLLRYLEELSGRTLRTREDIQAYVRELAVRDPREHPSMRHWLTAKRVTLAALLAFGVIQYYMLDVMLEIASLQAPTYFVPASTNTKVQKSALAPRTG